MKNLSLIACNVLWILGLLFLSTCDKYRVYETNIDFPNKRWYADSIYTYSFKIEDTTIRYNILYNVRNTLNYQFYNLYLKYTLEGPDKKIVSTDLQEVQLMDSKTGEPFGSGLGDIFDNRFYALKSFKFSNSGTYTMKVKQYMRQDPLSEILAFGLRIEKMEGK